MKCIPWLRRASWPLALGLSVLASGALAQDQPPPGAPPRPDAPAPPGGPHERIIMRHLVPGGQFGMAVAPIPKSLDAQLKLNGEGAVVVHVREGGAAAKAGLKVHDVVVAIDDQAVKDPTDLVKAVEESPEKERTLKLLRAGETLSVAVTPEKPAEEGERGWFDDRFRLDGDKLNINVREFRDLERTIREKLRNSGVDMRMQFIEPGAFLPRGAEFSFGRRTDLPDDISITVHKQGKKPADIEVKKGEESWNVKEDDLAPLPDEVRMAVEGYLGHTPMRFSIVRGEGEDGPGPRPPRGPGGPPRGPGDERFAPPPGGPAGPGGREGRREFRPPQRGPVGPPQGPGDEGFGPPDEGRMGGGLERQLEEMARRMEDMQRQLEGLRRNLGEDRGDRPPRARRPDRPERPAEPAETESDES